MTKPPLHTAIVDGVMAAFDAAAEKDGPVWVLRDGTEDDHPGIMALWLESAWRSRYGKRFLHDGGHADFKARHQPRIEAALARARIRIACAPDAPHVFFAYAVTEGTDTVHAVLVKRTFTRAGVSAEMLRALLGPMLERRCYVSGELPDMLRHETRAGGLTMPPQWIDDPYSLGGPPPEKPRRAA